MPEINAKLRPEFYPFFANYMVVKRVTQESNFQPLYMALIDKFNDPKLMSYTLKTTYHYIKASPRVCRHITSL